MFDAIRGAALLTTMTYHYNNNWIIHYNYMSVNFIVIDFVYRTGIYSYTLTQWTG